MVQKKLSWAIIRVIRLRVSHRVYCIHLSTRTASSQSGREWISNRLSIIVWGPTIAECFRSQICQNVRFTVCATMTSCTGDFVQVVELVNGNHYQVACARYFELVHHSDEARLGINHPNQYFEESRKLITGKKENKGLLPSSSFVSWFRSTVSNNTTSQEFASTTRKKRNNEFGISDLLCHITRSKSCDFVKLCVKCLSWKRLCLW